MSEGPRALRVVGLAGVWALSYAVLATLAHDGRWADRALGEGAVSCAVGLAVLMVLRVGLLAVWPGVTLLALIRWVTARRAAGTRRR
ncbi:MAG: hypothetical protein U0325_36295 [Polyangiales bacterium]